jgi:hypothetical protein
MNSSKNVLFLCFAVLFLMTASSFAAIRIVNPAGGPGIYTTIQAAVNDATPYDQIQIKNATYHETVTVNKNNLDFEGESVAGVIVAPTTVHGANGFVIASTSGLIIKNITFKDCNNGIVGSGVAGLTIDNVVFDNNVNGLYYNGGGTVTGLLAKNNTIGVYLTGTSVGNEIAASQFTGNTTAGLYIDGAASGLNIHGNKFLNNVGDGIKTGGDLAGDITGNTLALNAGYGINLSVPNTTGPLYISDNCLWENVAGQGSDPLSYPSAINYWYKCVPTCVGNYYNDYTGTGSYLLGIIGNNQDPYPKTATNNPTGPANVALNQVFTVDFVYTVAGCDPIQNMKGYDFTIHWDPTLLIYQHVTEGNYLKGTTGFVYDESLVSTGELHVTNASLDSFAVAASGILATVQFKAVSNKVGANNITTSSVYVDNYNKPMATSSAPLTVTVKDVVLPQLNTPTAISGSPTSNDVYSAAFPISLHYDASDDFYLYDVEYQIDALGWTVVPTAPWAPGTLAMAGNVTGISVAALASGSHHLYVRAYDGPPAWNVVIKDIPFTVDNTAPVAPVVTLVDKDGCAEAGWTSGVAVTATLTNAGSYTPTDTKIRWAYSGPTDGATITFASPFDFNLNTGLYGDVVHDIYMQVLDVYGNVSGWGGPFSIQLDRTAPTPSGFTLPTPVATTTITGNVTNYGGSNYFKQMTTETLADITCTSSNWGPMTTSPSVTIGSGYGSHTVYYAVRDYAGNSGYTTTTTFLDNVAPQFTVFHAVPDNGLPCANNMNFKIHMEWQVGADATWLSLAPTTGTLTWAALVADSIKGTTGYKDMVWATPIPYTGDGYYYVFGRLSDNLSNYSTEKKDSIKIDGTTPTAGTVTISRPAAGLYAWWTPSRTVNVAVAGFSADVVEYRWAETSGGLSTATWHATPPTTFTFSSSVLDCTNGYLWIEARDCGGNLIAAPIQSNPLTVDVTAPTLTGVSINGGAIFANNPAVSVALTAGDNCGLSQYMCAQDAAFTGATWQSYLTPFPFTITGADGQKILYVKVRDYADNVSPVKADTIRLDVAPPACVVTISPSSSCPDAAPGYTCNLTNCTVTLSAYPPDVAQMYINNPVDNSNSSWIQFSPSKLWNLVGAPGVVQVQVSLLDSAGNQTTGTWNTGSIIYDVSAPGVSGGGTVVEGNQMGLTWNPVSGAYKYQINYQRWNDYPLYRDPVPNYPLTVASPFVGMTNIHGTTASFDAADHQRDIYYLTIFACDSAGNWATSGLNLAGTNYLVGDYANFNGTLDFGAEFGALAAAFYTDLGDASWNGACDIGPTNDGTINGYPLADSTIDFEDLLIFAFNFDQHPGSKKPVVPSTGKVIVSAEIPATFNAGDEIITTVRVDNPAAIKGLSLTLPYDGSLLEPIAISKGNLFSSGKSAMFDRVKDSRIRIDGVIMGTDAPATATDVAVITFRAIKSGTSEFENPVIDVRDYNNKHIDAEFNTVAIATKPLPTVFDLSQNYPNPFNPTTNIELSLPVACKWQINIYNITGQVVKSFSGNSDAGVVQVTWDGKNENGVGMASGIYFYKATADGKSLAKTKKMVLLK